MHLSPLRAFIGRTGVNDSAGWVHGHPKHLFCLANSISRTCVNSASLVKYWTYCPSGWLATPPLPERRTGRPPVKILGSPFNPPTLRSLPIRTQQAPLPVRRAVKLTALFAVRNLPRFSVPPLGCTLPVRVRKDVRSHPSHSAYLPQHLYGTVVLYHRTLGERHPAYKHLSLVAARFRRMDMR